MLLNPLVAYPGTDLWKRLQREGRLFPDSDKNLGEVARLPNFLPARSVQSIARELINFYEVVYEPDRCLDRAFDQIRELGPAPSRTGFRWPRGDEWRMMFSVAIQHGIKNSTRWKFWRFLTTLLRRSPGKVPSFMSLGHGPDFVRVVGHAAMPGAHVAQNDRAGGNRRSNGRYRCLARSSSISPPFGKSSTIRWVPGLDFGCAVFQREVREGDVDDHRRSAAPPGNRGTGDRNRDERAASRNAATGCWYCRTCRRNPYRWQASNLHRKRIFDRVRVHERRADRRKHRGVRALHRLTLLRTDRFHVAFEGLVANLAGPIDPLARERLRSRRSRIP